MKRQKHISPKKSHLGLILGSVALVIILILIFKPSGDGVDDVGEEIIDQSGDSQQPVLQDEPEEEVDVEQIREDAVEVSSKKLDEKGLCEDYFFEQGDTLAISDHEIAVTKIGSTGFVVEVDGERAVLNGGDTKYLGDGIRLSIEKNNILYFGLDDPNNAVYMRVGCHYDDNPNDKYISDKGKALCEQVYTSCKSSFGLK